MIPRNFFYFEVFDRSEKNSDLRYVYDRTVRSSNCIGSNSYNLNECNVISLDLVETPKYIDQTIQRLKRSVAKLDISLMASETIADRVLSLQCLIGPDTRKSFFKSSSLMSGYLTSMFSKKFPNPVNKIYSFRLASYMIEFGLMSKTTDQIVIDALEEKFPIFSANNRYYICMENRLIQNEMEPTPANLTVYKNLLIYCLYVIMVSCILLSYEFIQVLLIVRHGKAKQVIFSTRSHSKSQVRTNRKSYKTKIAFHAVNGRKLINWNINSMC